MVRKTIALIATIIAIGSGVIGVITILPGLAAWGDYAGRDCPGAVQCDDAQFMMIMPLVCFGLTVSCGWLASRLFRAKRQSV